MQRSRVWEHRPVVRRDKGDLVGQPDGASSDQPQGERGLARPTPTGQQDRSTADTDDAGVGPHDPARREAVEHGLDHSVQEAEDGTDLVVYGGLATAVVGQAVAPALVPRRDADRILPAEIRPIRRRKRGVGLGVLAVVLPTRATPDVPQVDPVPSITFSTSAACATTTNAQM